ncbi:hypothetical protein EVAR_18310_1 [Eumeta japonica]|uniref:Uncharacterized protein n=1 Tax=Eumeta variegata TaxID=151549 RepID=A0A4C1VC46_EUMVA|nr:hypothetical protein EVAR_18310_1 [Eumeta japonica]
MLTKIAALTALAPGVLPVHADRARIANRMNMHSPRSEEQTAQFSAPEQTRSVNCQTELCVCSETRGVRPPRYANPPVLFPARELSPVK